MMEWAGVYRYLCSVLWQLFMLKDPTNQTSPMFLKNLSCGLPASYTVVKELPEAHETIASIVQLTVGLWLLGDEH